jgi:predicted TIM-barrel fold metal-dependent hydrolase
MNRRVVDVHTHFLPQALIGALERRDELPMITRENDQRLIHYGEGNIHPLLPAMADLQRRLADMDEQGIDVAVLSVNIPGTDWFPKSDGPAVAREVNDELADIVAAHPDRLAAMATLPMQCPEDAAAELERTHALGFRGGMVFSNAAGRPIDEPECRVVFDTAARLGVPIYVHPTYPLTAATVDAYALIPTLGFLFDTTTAAMRLVLGGLYERHPDFKLVLSHVASLIPYVIGRIDYEAERHRHLDGWGSLSVPPSEHLRLLYTDTVCVWAPSLRLVTEFLGPDRMMYGSDYPFWDPQRTTDTLADCGFDEDTVRVIESGTAGAVFGLGSPTVGHGGPR